MLLFLLNSAALAAPDPTPAPNTFISELKDAFSGYYKILTTFSKSSTTKENIFAALQRFRLEFKPKLTEKLQLNATYDYELLLSDFSNTSDFDLIRQNEQENFAFFDLDKNITDTKHAFSRHRMHRLYFQYEEHHARLIFGKQLIDWGRMRFYSPLDLFNQPLPTSLEADERPGFDALNAELFSDNFSGLNFIYGPGKNDDKTSYALKFYKKIRTYDTFLIAAKHEKDKVGGFGFDGYLGQAGFRGEYTYTKSGKEQYPRASLGFDYSFSQKTTLTAEYFYNGAANGDYNTFSSSVTDARQRLSLKKNLMSAMLVQELTPLLKFKLLGIYDTSGKSALVNPELRYNVIENLDVACGAQLFIESAGSEFENSNNLYYIEIKLFF